MPKDQRTNRKTFKGHKRKKLIQTSATIRGKHEQLTFVEIRYFLLITFPQPILGERRLSRGKKNMFLLVINFISLIFIWNWHINCSSNFNTNKGDLLSESELKITGCAQTLV